LEISLEDAVYGEKNIFGAFLEEYWGEIDPDFKKTRKFIDKYLEYLFHNHQRKVSWICAKKERIGLVVYYFYNSLGFSEQNLHISEFFIRKEYRRQGAGRKTIEKLSSSYPVKEFRLEALKSNEAGVRFWQSLGFEPWKYIMKKTR